MSDTKKRLLEVAQITGGSQVATGLASMISAIGVALDEEHEHEIIVIVLRRELVDGKHELAKFSTFDDPEAEQELLQHVVKLQAGERAS